MSGIIKDGLILMSASVFNRLPYVVLVTTCKENQDSYRHAVGKKMSISITFSDNDGYSPLLLHQGPWVLMALGTLEGKRLEQSSFGGS